MSEMKKTLRNEVLQRVASWTEEERAAASRYIASRLYAQPKWQHAETIGITVSVRHEVHTYEIIQQAWKEGKRVAVPKCDRRTNTITFRVLTSFNQLETVYMDLQEPSPDLTEEALPHSIPLLLVPGVAFDRACNRLGYGGGYYDRFLAGYTGYTIALAFSAQLVPSIPVGEHDKPVDMMITEHDTISR